MTPTGLIDTPGALAELCSALQDERFIAVDTEFIRERTYYPRVCLIQVATASAAGCVDVLAVDDLEPLMSILLDENTTKVLHAGRQDLEIFFQLAGEVPAPVFDSQIAADLTGLGDQAGLAAVAKALLDVQVDKSHARANWARRPLPVEHLQYALDDVRYLVPIFEQLEASLADRGRLSWLEEDCERLVLPELYRIDPETAWQRVKGIGRLTSQRFHAARLLASWRERRAMQLDRPRNWVMRDEVTVALAAAMPGSVEALSRVEGLPKPLLQMAPRILDIVKRASQIDAAAPDQLSPLTSDQRARASKMMQHVREVAASLGVSPSRLATRRDITALVRNQDAPVLHGWRRPVIGQALLAFGP